MIDFHTWKNPILFFYLPLFLIVLLTISTFSCIEEEVSQPYDLVLENGRVMDPESGLDAVRNIGIRDGKITEMSVVQVVAEETVDVSGLVVAPGFIDLNGNDVDPEEQRKMKAVNRPVIFKICCAIMSMIWSWQDRARTSHHVSECT